MASGEKSSRLALPRIRIQSDIRPFRYFPTIINKHHRDEVATSFESFAAQKTSARFRVF